MECCEVFKAFGLLRLFNVCFSLSISCKVINLNTNIVFEERILQSKIVSDFYNAKTIYISRFIACRANFVYTLEFERTIFK